MEMTVELFDSIINTSQDCVFWKDKDRRFLGVNQAFLDFYGFDSADVLIGKTDEDMGWHSDPEPYKQDELRVLAGRSTYKVQGKCIIRGEERDIIASKRPLYDDGQIVGLVGSFVDITDVLRRKNGLGGGQVVYSIDNLRKFAFFDRIIDEIGLDEILDPLTGVLSRAYSVKFVRSLIAEGRPFTFSMIDLDNFKHINDSFGHGAGDEVLKKVAKSIADASDGFGLAGRFGGDELLLIDLKNISQEDKKAFFESLFNDSGVFRNIMRFDNGESLITGTAGSATYPDDAFEYESLFNIIDKMLYLGKSRGRNCFTIYDSEKHSNIETTQIARRSIFEDMRDLRLDTEKEKDFEGKLKAALPRLCEILKISDLYYVLDDGRLRGVNDKSLDEPAGDISGLVKDDLYSGAISDQVRDDSPELFSALTGRGFESVLISRIRSNDQIQGYLICAVKRINRIWQETECAILYYFAGLLI